MTPDGITRAIKIRRYICAGCVSQYKGGTHCSWCPFEQDVRKLLPLGLPK